MQVSSNKQLTGESLWIFYKFNYLLLVVFKEAPRDQFGFFGVKHPGLREKLLDIVFKKKLPQEGTVEMTLGLVEGM